MNQQQLIRLVPEAESRHALPTINQSALLVIDMQEYFRPIATGIIPGVKRVIDVCRRSGVPVIYTQHGHNDPEESGMLSEWWEGHIIPGSDEALIVPEIQPATGERVMAKDRYSAFYRTDLEDQLRKSGIKDMIISGVMTNLCCETTARDAFVRDFRVFFLADGTATSGDDYHIAALRNLAYGFAYILTCDEIVQYLGSQ